MRGQKLFFLLWKAGLDKFVSEPKEMAAYNCGPFSNSRYDDIEFAKSIGLIGVAKSMPKFQIEISHELESCQHAMDPL